MQCTKTVMLLSYLRENDARLQWRQPWSTVRVDVIVSARHFPRKYDSNMTVFIHRICPIYICRSFKGTCSRLAKFVYNFLLSQTLYISSMRPSLNRTTIFKLIVHWIERVIWILRKERLILIKKWELSFSPTKLHDVYKHKWLVTLFTNNDIYEWFRLCLSFNPF